MKENRVLFRCGFLLTIVALVCVACATEIPSAITATPQFVASATSTGGHALTPLTIPPTSQDYATTHATPSKTSPPTAISSPTPPRLPSVYASVPPGQYVLWWETDPDNHLLVFATSPDGHLQIKLPVTATIDVMNYPRISADGRWLFYEKDGIGYLFDLFLNSEAAHFSVRQLKDCQYDFLPNMGRLVSLCGDDFSVEFMLRDKPAVHLSSGGIYPTWSPDGRWIAYFVFKSVPNPKPGQVELGSEDGLYLMDTSCLENPTSCIDRTRGPYPISPQALSWSPDAKYLAVGHSIFDVNTGKWGEQLELDSLGSIGALIWSPDDKQIAVSATGQATDFSEAGIYVVPVIGGGRVAAKIPNCKCDGVALAWIAVP
jgi:WD40 repeat protein